LTGVPRKFTSPITRVFSRRSRRALTRYFNPINFDKTTARTLANR